MSNLMVIANSLKRASKSSYKQIQKISEKPFGRRGSGLAEFQLELLRHLGKLDLVVDRARMASSGAVWINILAVQRRASRGDSVGWKVFSRKEVVSGRKHVIVLRQTVQRLGAGESGKCSATVGPANREMLAYLFENNLDFCLRLKKANLANGVAFSGGYVSNKHFVFKVMKSDSFGLHR